MTKRNEIAKKYIGMELKDWKDIERAASEQLHSAIASVTVNQILIEESVVEIHKLGGKTIQEESDEMEQATTKP